MLHVLSAGAAKQVVLNTVPTYTARYGEEVKAQFGAVGAMAEIFTSGARCDVLITSETMYHRLAGAAVPRWSESVALGRVPTSIGVRDGDGSPDVTTSQALAACLLEADGIYCPDTDRATAGIHLVSVLDQLGILEQVRPRLRVFPNGAAAMAALVQSRDARPIGCTQATEIIYTEGIRLVAPLPEPHGLATVYCAVDTSAAPDRGGARFIDLLTGPEGRRMLQQAGFAEP